MIVTYITALVSLLLLFHTPLNSKSFFLYRSLRAQQIKIKTAPRAWASVHKGIVFFTEKSTPPANFKPGTVYRELYRIKKNSKHSRKLTTLGHIFQNPLLDSKQKKLYFLKRTHDSNKDGIISDKDNRVLYSIAFKSGTEQQLTPFNQDFELIAIIIHKRALLVRSRNTLFLLNPDNKQLKKLENAPQGIKKLFFSQDGSLFIFYNKKLYKMQEEQFILYKKGITVCQKKGIKIALFPAKHRFKFRANPSYTATLDSNKISYLLTLHPPMLHLFLYKDAKSCHLFAGHLKQRSYQRLFHFPQKTSRIYISNDKTELVFLVTYDTNRDSYTTPGSTDRSTIYYLSLGQWSHKKRYK